MKTKAPHLANPWKRADDDSIIAAYFEFVHLKHLFRQGWLAHNIPENICESVAEHTFGVALVAMLIADHHYPNLDIQKVLRMSLIHDIGEVYAGDITPDSGINSDLKHQHEAESFQRVFGGLPLFDVYLDLWKEFEAGESPEAQFVRQIDKLEMALQASVYEHQNIGDLLEFFSSAQKGISSPELNRIIIELEKSK